MLNSHSSRDPFFPIASFQGNKTTFIGFSSDDNLSNLNFCNRRKIDRTKHSGQCKTTQLGLYKLSQSNQLLLYQLNSS